MKYHISRFIIRNKPTTAVTPPKAGRAFSKNTTIQHVRVERRLGFLIRKAAGFRLGGEIILKGLPKDVTY